MSTMMKLSLLDSSSPLMEQMMFFHDHTMMILIVILSMVGYMMIQLMLSKESNKLTMENQSLEMLWTILPAIILIFIAMPSLKVLYMTDETENPNLSLKVMGHQWYWSYEYPEFKNKEFDAYMMQWESEKMFRLLDVDNNTPLPLNTLSRIILSSTDVIHAWTIPTMAVKMDAVPGRLNQMNMVPKTYGLYFGQCSEICGANHSFMPISLQITSPKKFISLMKNM